MEDFVGQATTSSTIVLALRSADSPVRPQMARLTKAAPPPLDHGALLTVAVGAATAATAAVAILRAPKTEVRALLDEIRQLCAACLAEYERRAGAVDSDRSLEGRLRANSAWVLLSRIGSAPNTDHPAIVAAGMELLLSWWREKAMAESFCRGARTALSSAELAGVQLTSVLEVQEGEISPHWIKHGRNALTEFFTCFDGAPPRPLPPRPFEDRARTELSCRAAFASYRRRAGILDDTCLSERQIAAAVSYTGAGQFRDAAERRAAIWLIGITGLFATSVQFLPLADASPLNWVLTYDVQLGVLRRDFSCLAADAARPRAGDHANASFIALTPAPRDVADTIRQLAADAGSPGELGDLIPALRSISPRTLVYPDLSELAPSFARWSRTLAPFALRVGLDALVAAVTCGDGGVTARSKLHYCLIDHSELWDAARTLYRALGWVDPVPMPHSTLCFGAVVVPRAEALSKLDAQLCMWVEEARPPKRIGNEAKLLEFHNRYTRALATRIATWVSLRPAAELPVRASVHEDVDRCVDIVEKASAGRFGALPAVMCDAMRRELGAYRAHCAALYERLRTLGWSGPVMTWLIGVSRHDDIPLLCTISSSNRALPVGTTDLLRSVPGLKDFAPDWGRKFTENHLRLLGAQTRDIDRHQRHEVQGQEQDTSVSDGNELDWTRRLAPALDLMSRALFRGRLFGLRQKGLSA